MKLDITKANKWRLPKVCFSNYKKEFSNMTGNCFKSWFSFRRYWGGKLWNISIKHYVMTVDFRLCVMSDLMWPNATKQDRNAVKEANKYI